ncbi:hypothetical protein CRV08_00290 [Halarcobacter ebronensis]|uniref:Redoxin domain-containing protein n=1 Tax=Halarcobacter ebronensis TaxID=1462615 RepID=A0A4Q0YHC6_9BACT|nr:hypothetical protein [Halarcobacter ebronensis]RXJ70037.1 hypothetical protein CRV08_00290 [Halarcobacter ebronensis]
MSNILKIVFLGLVGFSLLVFFTADKPKQIVASENVVNIIKYDSLPSTFELVGKNDLVKKENLFEKNKKYLIVVGSHDSLAVVKELPNLFKLDIAYVMVANISAAPWFVKKMFIPGKLEELNENSKTPMIYDFNGDMVNSLKVNDTSKTKFFAFLLTDVGTISKIYDGEVKNGAIDGSMSKEEIISTLKPLVESLNNN